MTLSKRQKAIAGAVVLLTETKDQYEWKDVVAAVNAAGIAVPNWMEVRGLMQSVNNSVGWARTKDVRSETYAPK